MNLADFRTNHDFSQWSLSNLKILDAFFRKRQGGDAVRATLR